VADPRAGPEHTGERPRRSRTRRPRGPRFGAALALRSSARASNCLERRSADAPRRCRRAEARPSWDRCRPVRTTYAVTGLLSSRADVEPIRVGERDDRWTVLRPAPCSMWRAANRQSVQAIAHDSSPSPACPQRPFLPSAANRESARAACSRSRHGRCTPAPRRPGRRAA
jgi:hypothetical protein